jgi:hypothetical protein
MESKSRRTPRVAASVEDRPPAATRAAPQPAVAPRKPPAIPQPALPPDESAAAPPSAAPEDPAPAAPFADRVEDPAPPPSAAPEDPAPAAPFAERVQDPAPPAALALPPMPLVVQPAPAIAAEISDDMLSAIAQSRAALARGLEAIGNEVASFARHSLDASARAAIQLLEAKTWADAVAVNSGLARTSFDYWLGSTAKVSELGIKLAIDWSKPLASEFGKVWSGTQPAR